MTLKHIGHTCMSFSLLTSAKVKIWYITMGIHLLRVYEVNPHDFHPTHPLFIKYLYSTIGMKDCVLPEKKIHLPHPSPFSSAPIPLNFSFGNPCLLTKGIFDPLPLVEMDISLNQAKKNSFTLSGFS